MGANLRKIPQVKVSGQKLPGMWSNSRSQSPLRPALEKRGEKGGKGRPTAGSLVRGPEKKEPFSMSMGREGKAKKKSLGTLSV